MISLAPIDRALVAATQAGLPLDPAPYARIGEKLGLTETQVIERFRSMMETGIVRRIGLAANHYALGLIANGMTVWDVEDERAETLGALVGALSFVSHCYLRRRAPGWRYNLFAMAHGATREEVEDKRAEIAAMLADACRASDILYSTRILKKTGLRLKTTREA